MVAKDLGLKASRCLESGTSGDFVTTRALLHDQVTYDGPMGRGQGADDYVSGVADMAESVNGVELKRVITDGEDVCIVYDLLRKDAAALPTVGWYHFTGDTIDAVRAYFDPRPLVEMGSGPPGRASLQIPLFAAGLQLCDTA